ncbi:MAG: bis(5'-nucleosyl)-tetraphosphatase (symmetrical) YqeK, partial [Dehalococcoidia bacterium]
DVARATKGEGLLSLAREFGLAVGPLEEKFPVFLHGPVGAEVVRRDYQVRDEEVLEAIRCHTVGGWGMGPVARVVYLADKLEPSKDARYPFSPRVRELARRDLDGALLEFMSREVSAHIARGDFVHPSTIEARNDLLARLRSSSHPARG